MSGTARRAAAAARLALISLAVAAGIALAPRGRGHGPVFRQDMVSRKPDAWKALRAALPNAAIVAHGFNNSTEMLPLKPGRGRAGGLRAPRARPHHLERLWIDYAAESFRRVLESVRKTKHVWLADTDAVYRAAPAGS